VAGYTVKAVEDEELRQQRAVLRLQHMRGRAVKVLIAIGLNEEFVEQVRAVDTRLEVSLLDREATWLFQGRPLSSEVDREAVQQRLHAALAEVEVLYGFPPSPERARDLLARAPRLRWFQAASAGVDRLEKGGFLERQVVVTNSSGVHPTPIGEYVLMVMLMFAKGAQRFLRAQAERRWTRFLPAELKGRTVGIVGMGRIGTEVARLAKAVGCRVLGIRRSAAARRTGEAPADEVLPPSDLPYLLSESDFVVLAVPLTRETHHIIGKNELRAMKPTAVLINISRGAAVDEAALVRALREGWIGGAGLDVFEREPLPEDSELWGMENVIVSPHISGGTELYLQRAVPIFCENLRRYLDGRPLLNVVDPERAY
jgi:phosphoglycerate dehydrogenase-like enzyme